VTADDHPTDAARAVEGVLERAIAVQVRRHRRARGMTVGELAVRAGISKAMLSKIENSLTSSSLTTLARLAAALDVPVTALFRGADGHREAVFTPAGGTALGPRSRAGQPPGGPGPRMEAHLVTLTERGELLPPFRHPGTELVFMLEGEMVYGHGEASYTLAPGDALQLDAEGVHGPLELISLPIRFLSVVAHRGPHG
jgi:DNA-binding XRE family transcriptional regulator/quercetin dioxygenase-like cupin family protein